MTRPLILATLLGASVGVPYLASNSPEGLATNWFDSEPSAPSQPAGHVDGLRGPRPGGLVYDSPAPLGGVPTYSLADVLRFDVTREWVYARWARKSTGLADPENFGIRVPLVTGTGMGDLAGSLTYYFNARGQVQHLSFHGRTADTGPIVTLATQRFGLTRVQAPPGEQIFQALHRGRPQSQLVTRPESVLWATSPHTSFAVELELERPGSNRLLQATSPPLEIPGAAATIDTQHIQPQEPIPVGPLSWMDRATNRMADEPTDAPAATQSAESVEKLERVSRPYWRWPN